MLALLLRGIQTGEVKDSVMVLQVWNQQVYGNVNEGWDVSSAVNRIPTDWIKLFTLPINC